MAWIGKGHSKTMGVFIGMNDSHDQKRDGYDVARLRIEFEGEEIPWMYPLALNGRVIKDVFVDNERYERERTCHAIAIYNMHDE